MLAQQQSGPKQGSVVDRVSMGVEAVANTVVGVPKAIGGAADLVVGTLGSETGVGVAVAAAGGYGLLQGSGQLTSAIYEGIGAITGKTAGVDDKVDMISASTSIAGATATVLNHGDFHSGSKWAAAEGVFSGTLRREIVKDLPHIIDFIMNIKDLVTK